MPRDAARPAVERVHPPDALMRVINPLMRRMLTSPLARGRLGEDLMLLRYAGRRSGRPFALPVGRQEHDGHTAVFTNSRWRHNFRGGHPAELVDRTTPRPVTGRLIDDPDVVTDAYMRQIEAIGDPKRASRRLGLRINVGRAPTRDELRRAIATSGLGIVVLEPR